MKKILMVCNYFAPDNKIAAIRITKLAKYFKQHGYEVTVISEQKQDVIEDEILKKDAEGIHTHVVSNSECMKRFVSTYKKVIAPIRQKRFDNLDDRMRVNKITGTIEFYPFPTAHPIIGSLDYLVELLREYDLFWASKSFLKTLEEPTYIFTSYGGYFGILEGKYLHKKYRKTPWIMDMRDHICQYRFTPQYVRWIAGMFEKYVCNEADCITAISKGLCQTMPRKYWKKIHCVTNGFDREERKNIFITEEAHKKLRFTYTGAMYGGWWTLSPVFKNLKALADRKEIDIDKLEFCFAGKESAYKVFVSQAYEYGLDGNCVYYGSLERKESLKLQMESDILLVASWNSKIERGIITGKALEYMASNKPMIAIISGDMPHSELGEMIRSARLGFAYEEADDERNNNELYLYLLEKYREFIEKGRLEHNPDKKILNKYDYKYLGKKMLKIIESTDY